MPPAPHSSPPASPSDNWLRLNIDRRRFIQGAGLTAAALFFFPRASLLAAPAKAKKQAGGGQKTGGQVSPPKDYALNPVRPALDSWKPPQGVIPADGPVALDFDIVIWDKAAGGKAQPIAKLTIGHMRIARAPDAGGAVRYTIKRDLNDIASETEITCRVGAGGIEQVESWKTQWPAITQTGAVRDGSIVVTTNKAERTVPLPAGTPLIADASLYCNAALPGLLADACAGGKTFARLDQLLSLREKQRLRPDIPVAAPWDSAVSLQSWLLTGPGIPPTNILFDPEKRPLFGTAFLLSTALHNIS